MPEPVSTDPSTSAAVGGGTAAPASTASPDPSMGTSPVASARPRAADFRAVNRGGGLLSEAVSQPVGAWLSVVAHRVGAPPTALTVANLVLGLTASALVTAAAPAAAAGRLPMWPVGAVALLLWHLAYALDCADGQLARVTGRTSPSGARVDILCDVAVQISLVTAVAAVGVGYRPGTPTWLVAVFAGTWMVNLVTSVMASGTAAASLVGSTSLPVRLVKLTRDYAAMVTACGLVITLAPATAVWVMGGFTVVNGGFLLASIVQSAVAALRAGRHGAPPPRR